MAVNKYRAIKTYNDGKQFASKAESRRYSELKLLQRAGEISDLKLQPQFPFIIGDKPVISKNKRQLKYIADFSYVDRNGSVVIEDCKGFFTPESRLKIALTEAIYGIEVRLVK